ncbi:MAG: nuclear transport factor 2 family protein, partial [Candidatus Eremiobacteraeota bacterium]|nr:nuclear transport factor 2 family protein [Candidatus Eremiobacteraeota bacterium]
MYFARLAVLALSLAVVAPQSVAAQSTPELPAAARQALATVQRFVDAFNRGDVAAVLATCAPRASIIDEVPPHEWQGANACGD